MRKKWMVKAAVIMLIAATLFNGSIVSADDSFLTLDMARKKIVEKSVQLQVQNNYIQSLKKNAEDAKITASQANDMLRMDIRFTQLAAMTNRTPQEETEYGMLKQILGLDGLDLNSYYQFEVTGATIVDTMYYMYHSNINRKDVMMNSLTQTANEQYAAILKMKESIVIQQKLSNNLERNLIRAKSQYKLNRISRVDMEAIEYQAAIAKLNLKVQQRNLNSMIAVLNRLMGEKPTKTYTNYSSDGIIMPKQIGSYESYLSLALKNRAEILNAEEYRKIKLNAYNIAKKYYKDTDENYKTAAYDLEDAENTLEQIKLNIESEITLAFNDFQGKFDNVKSAELMYQTAKTAYEKAVNQYAIGAISEKVLTDADIKQTQAALQLTSARYDLWLYSLRMSNACGSGPGISSQKNGMGR